MPLTLISQKEISCARDFVPSLGYKTGAYAPRRSLAASVTHTTGMGVVRKWRRSGAAHGEATPFETAIRVYSKQMKPGPHLLIGQREGECIQMCPIDLAAWGVGSKAGLRPAPRVYSGEWYRPEYGWWRERWPDYSSPLELAHGEIWAGGSCNGNTWQTEVVPPEDGGPWSDWVWACIVSANRELSRRHEIPLSRDRRVTHSDVHPIARTRKGAPWDPPREQWRWNFFMKASCDRTPPRR